MHQWFVSSPRYGIDQLHQMPPVQAERIDFPMANLAARFACLEFNALPSRQLG